MWRTITTILWKDLKIEIRTREALSASFIFAVLVLVIFNFAMNLSTKEAVEAGAGVLWVAFAFAGVLSLNHSYALEKEENCVQALVMAPVDRGAIYIGKFLANVISMFVTGVIILFLFAVLFNIDIAGRFWLLTLILLLGTIGFSSVGTVFAVIAGHTRMREVMLPILFLPITVPVLFAAVETTAFALGAVEDASFWFTLLIVYDVVFFTVCFITFDYVLQD